MENAAKLDKRDVDKYLKKVNDDKKDVGNSKIADALKGFKF